MRWWLWRTLTCFLCASIIWCPFLGRCILNFIQLSTADCPVFFFNLHSHFHLFHRFTLATSPTKRWWDWASWQGNVTQPPPLFTVGCVLLALVPGDWILLLSQCFDLEALSLSPAAISGSLHGAQWQTQVHFSFHSCGNHQLFWQPLLSLLPPPPSSWKSQPKTAPPKKRVMIFFF